MTEEAAQPRELLTPEEAAQRLSISRTRVYQLMARGELASATLGRSRRVFADSVREFAQRLREQTGGIYR